MSRRVLSVLLVLGLVLAACRSTSGPCTCAPAPAAQAPRYGDAWVGLPGTVALDEVPAPAAVRDILLTVYPTPRRADYGDVLLPLDGARIVDESSPDVEVMLVSAGIEPKMPDLPPEGYAFAVLWDGNRATVLLVARDDPGRTWAQLAFDQLTTEVGDRRYVRAARILDAPVFPLRGNKRPQTWERRYGANFAWEAKERPEFAGRETVATYAPGSPLDATRAGVERILEQWRPWQERGVQRFCLKFDDVGFDLTPETERQFGAYGAAVRTLLTSLRSGLRDGDPNAVLYFLPQTYWWNDPRMGAYARALDAAGGIDPDIGLVLTGPEIVSDTIDAAGLAATRALFGSTMTPALLYDNRGREGDWGPLEGREPALASLADGVFGERGTPVNRLTRLDWLWNPGAYDPERSWRRAILELAGPEGYEDLHAACAAFRRGAPREEAAACVARFANHATFDGPLPQVSLASLLRSDLARLDTVGRPAAPATGSAPR